MKLKTFQRDKELFFLVTLFFVSFSLSFAQNSKLDSLQNVLSSFNQKDTTRVNLLIQVANEIPRKNIDKAIKLSKESLELADSIGYVKGKAKGLFVTGELELTKLNLVEGREYIEKALTLYKELSNKKEIARCLSEIGHSYTYGRDSENAIIYYKKALLISEEIKDSVKILKTLGNLGISYSRKGEHEKALDYFKRSLKINEEFDDKKSISKSLNHIGIVYARQANYPEALEYFLKALEITQKLGNKREIVRPLHNIGNIYNKQENYSKALEYLKKSLVLVEEMNETKAIAGTSINLGNIYLKLGQIDKALEYFRKALAISEEKKLNGLMANSLHNLGMVYNKKKEYESSLKYFQRALAIRLKIGDRLGASDSYIGISNAYYGKRDYTKALNNTLEAHELAMKLKNIASQKKTYELLSKVYYDTKKYKKAYENQLGFKKVSDSLFNKKKIEKMTQLQYEYAYKKRLDSAAERERFLKNEVNIIDGQLEASQEQKLWWIIGFFGLIVFLIFMYRKQRFEQLKAQVENNNLRFQALNMQMNPHFIYNSLSSIQQFVLGNDSFSAQQYLTRFSFLIRAILSACKRDTISLEKEIDIINNYAELEKKRFENVFDFEIVNNVDDSSEIYLPPLLIQPLVENAIIHGVSTLKDRKGFIRISFNMVDQELECVIEDNGIGIETSKKEREQRIIGHESIALNNIKERLKLLDKKKGQRLFVHPSSSEEYGTETRIVIPVLL
ncbi:Tetratricopeptide repeat protein [Tenacibaculum sp. 190130A14a]|uniref:Tetratricopeptide repeat protein n=1 Tax=Tenacibaculum polynesiense TaxID=3137857 RepID=A0ABM9PF25_9FLAO